MRVKVTQEHIKKSRRNNVSKCPIALATGGTVGLSMASVGSKEYWLPEVAKAFIRRIDAGENCEPIEFDMTEVSPSELAKLAIND